MPMQAKMAARKSTKGTKHPLQVPPQLRNCKQEAVGLVGQCGGESAISDQVLVHDCIMFTRGTEPCHHAAGLCIACHCPLSQCIAKCSQPLMVCV